MKKKIIVLFVCMLLIATVSPVSGIINDLLSYSHNVSTINDGILSGYVNDTSMNPIEGALVRVYFHETYEEDYTDSIGYYHITNIPICYCLKNCTASKNGYKTEWDLLSIVENTTYDFVLTHLNEYNGSLSGYVNDTFMNPIEGARVRVYFHETYEENYTDSSGYYNVNNIPICYCLKNCTASKSGYTTEWILLSIVENTTYDFVLKSSNTSAKWVVTDNPITSDLNNIQKNSGMKTLYMKADCNKILLYQRLLWPAHMGPFWFTSNFSYLCFFIEEDFVLKIDGVDQEVELPAMVVPWRFIGLGPLFWIRNIADPCNGNVTLMGICQDVIIEPYNTSMTT